MLSQRRRAGLAALMDVAGLKDAPSAYTLGFLLGPRINAGGRIAAPDLGLRLLLETDPVEARGLAARLPRPGPRAERVYVLTGHALALFAAAAASLTPTTRPEARHVRP